MQLPARLSRYTIGCLSTLIGMHVHYTALLCKAEQAAGRLVALLVELHYFIHFHIYMSSDRQSEKIVLASRSSGSECPPDLHDVYLPYPYT